MQNFKLHRFDLAALPTTAWKNGGGSTTELWCEPSGAGLDNFHWRVSVACIASDGPFSLFPGVDRIITLLQGGGVRLSGPGGVTQMELTTPFSPFAFLGETPITATRLGGDSLDFNVMTRRGRAQANCQTFRHQPGTDPVIKASYGLVLCVADVLTGSDLPAQSWDGTSSQGGEVQSLLPGQGLIWSPAKPSAVASQNESVWRWRSAAGSALLAVGFELDPTFM